MLLPDPVRPLIQTLQPGANNCVIRASLSPAPRGPGHPSYGIPAIVPAGSGGAPGRSAGLNVLAELIPRGWRHPRKPRTEIGRNVSLFRSGMAWAGRTHNLDLDVFNYLGGINGEVAEDLGRPPLGYSELAGIAKSVERYRREWVAQGRFCSPEEVAAYARNGQRLSVQARRRNNRGRDEDMVVRAYAGESVSAIARVHGCLRNTVRDVLETRRADHAVEASSMRLTSPSWMVRPAASSTGARRMWGIRSGR